MKADTWPDKGGRPAYNYARFPIKTFPTVETPPFMAVECGAVGMGIIPPSRATHKAAPYIPPCVLKHHNAQKV